MSLIVIDAGNSRLKSAVPDKAGNSKLILSRFGDPFVPSAIYYNSDGSIVIGTEALNAGFLEAKRLVKNWKRAMGTDEVLYEAENGMCYRAMDVLAILLQEIKSNAEAQTGEVIDEAVILRAC